MSRIAAKRPESKTGTPALRAEHGELNDHLINLTKDDVREAGPSICAATRWLFHKRDLAAKLLKREASWEEAVLEYKSYLKGVVAGKNKNPTGIETFRNELKRLKAKT